MTFGELSTAVRELLERGRELLHSEGRELDIDERPDREVRIALVGPYNVGKSTIVAGLTGRDDILIGASPTTSEVSAYEWRPGVVLLDTPGVRTGRVDQALHDAETESALADSDLVLFVITGEGFDDTLADYFLDVLVTRRRIGSVLLVINKCGRARGVDRVLDHVREVLDPVDPETLPHAVLDARYHLRAAREEGERAARLEALSGWKSFEECLHEFVDGTVDVATRLAPLHALRASLVTLIENRSTADPGSRRGRQLVTRRERILHRHETELRTRCERAITGAVREIEALGGRVAAGIQPEEEFDPEDLQREIDAGLDAVRERLELDLTHEMARALERTLEQLDELAADPVLIDLEGDIGGPRVGGGPDSTSGGAHARFFAERLGQVGSFFSQNHRAGELGHRAVYWVGRRIGVKFQPWGVTNLTKTIGRRLGRVSAILTVAVEAHDAIKERRVRRELANSRHDLREGFAEHAEEVRRRAWKLVEGAIHGSYGEEIEVTRERRDQLEAEERRRNESFDRACSLRDEIDVFLASVDWRA